MNLLKALFLLPTTALTHVAAEYGKFKAAGELSKDGKHCSQCGIPVEQGEKLCDECDQWHVI
ncbi:hypothetical protein [Sphingomonas sp. PB4P5]|uniref:hypothetical protein n=1 Tax=Parasphingomonas puruogangriensis TaxID=3096155 RepID=UPI002FCBF62D